MFVFFVYTTFKVFFKDGKEVKDVEVGENVQSELDELFEDL